MKLVLKNGKREFIWRCTCGGNHFLSLHPEDDGTPFAYLSLQGDFHAPSPWWKRVKVLWGVLRSGHYDSWVELYLSAEECGEVGTMMTAFAKKNDGAAK